MFVVLVALLWLPASSHALLEFVELIHDRHHDHVEATSGSHQHHQTDHDAADGNCALSFCKVKVRPPGLLKDSQPILLPASRHDALANISLPLLGPAPPGAAPPSLLISIWQFTFRAALPPRAPSSVS